MSRLRLIRQVTASGSGWAGDGTVWDGSTAPSVATTNATEVGTPVARPVSELPTRGWYGIVNVLDGSGNPSSKRFELRIVVRHTKTDLSGVVTHEWQEPAGDNAPTAPDPLEVGNGEDFTTDPMVLVSPVVAFHLVPIGGNLASGSKVQVWATEF